MKTIKNLPNVSEKQSLSTIFDISKMSFPGRRLPEKHQRKGYKKNDGDHQHIIIVINIGKLHEYVCFNPSRLQFFVCLSFSILFPTPMFSFIPLISERI